mmetsp:Transcript_1538/g.1731  ORF Transcript_1538/g.1731 Transcript_1538/m.1731 type:complete len:313 (+) Transcript_1538:108-1046(+)
MSRKLGRIAKLRGNFEQGKKDAVITDYPQPGSVVIQNADCQDDNVMDALLNQLADFKTLSRQPKPPVDKCKEQLIALRIAMMQFPFKDPANLTAGTTDKQLLFSREVLEQAVEFCQRTEDADAFERYIQQLKPYYTDYEPFCGPVSERKYPNLGLYLLHLLAERRIAEFHTEIELIPIQEQQKNRFIKYAVTLEQDLMEGRYNKIWLARKDVPLDSYTFIINRLTSTLRHDIADCIEKSYPSLSMGEAQKLLMFDSSETKAFEDFIEDRVWATEMEEIKFVPEEEEQKTASDNAVQLILQQLAYADELEKII